MEGDKSSSGVRWRRRFKVSHNNQNKARQGRAGQGKARQGGVQGRRMSSGVRRMSAVEYGRDALRCTVL